MSKNRTYITIGVILVLAALAGGLVFDWEYLPERPFRLGLDLQGGLHLVYEADLSEIPQEDHVVTMQGLRDIIERRVDLFGVVEPIVQIQEVGGRHRLIVELAGIEDPDQAIEMIGQTPYLEFKEKRIPEETEKILAKIKEIEGKDPEELMKIEDWHLAFEDPHFQTTPLTGRYLKEAEVTFDQLTHRPLVSLQFDDEGAQIFEELTERNVGKSLAIYIDGAAISIPTVQEVISGGRAQISGDFTVVEARELARNLSAGALPVPIDLISQQSVGPTLGAVSLEQSLQAGIWGLLAVIVFMILFYRLPGLLAALSLIIYALLILALFKLIPVTLTMAGIGGFILSIGMAIDANILIFSRLWEEVKSGASLPIAVEEGFRRAWPSIRDGNITTLIVALILFFLGTGFVRGFALTLTIGIMVSMFSALIITKNFIQVFMGTKLDKIKILWQ